LTKCPLRASNLPFNCPVGPGCPTDAHGKDEVIVSIKRFKATFWHHFLDLNSYVRYKKYGSSHDAVKKS
jgi:hypothetical protein